MPLLIVKWKNVWKYAVKMTKLIRRNGKLSKMLKTADDTVEIETPRDRAGTFEPQLIKNLQNISLTKV